MWRWAEELSWHRVEYTYGHVYPNNVILYLNYLLGDPTRWIRGSWGFQICKQNFSTTKIDGAMAIWKSTKFSIFRQKNRILGQNCEKGELSWKCHFYSRMWFFGPKFRKISKISKKVEKSRKSWKNLEKSQKKSKNLEKSKKS